MTSLSVSFEVSKSSKNIHFLIINEEMQVIRTILEVSF